MSLPKQRISRVLEAPFRAECMLLPYPAPGHARLYEETFECPVAFDQPKMEWRFDAGLLDRPLPNANPITAEICRGFCGRLLEAMGGEPEIVRAIRAASLEAPTVVPKAEAMASRLGISQRTMHRRLAAAGATYRDVVDGVRKQLAIEYLEGTRISTEEIAALIGFSDASNFRKAFKKWTGVQPTRYRARAGLKATIPPSGWRKTDG